MLKRSNKELLESDLDLLGSLGDRIRHLLNIRKISVAELAQVLGVSRQSCYKWLRNNQISDANLLKVASFLEVAPQWLKFGVAEPAGCVADCDGSCTINCGLKQLFIDRFKTRELIWELCLERKSIQWHGSSDALLGRPVEELPDSIFELLQWVCHDYRDIFLQPIRRAVLSAELSSTLVPLCLGGDTDNMRWVNSTIYTNCGGKFLLGGFTPAEVPGNPEALQRFRQQEKESAHPSLSES